MPPGKATRLQDAAEKEAALQDQLVFRFEHELQITLRRLDRELARLVRQLAAEDGRLIRTRQAIGRAVRLRRDIVQALEAAGYPQLATEATSTWLNQLGDLVLQDKAIAGRAAALTPVRVNALAAVQEVRLAELLGWSEGLTHQAWRLVLDGVLGLRPVDDLIEDLQALLDTSLPRARTLYDTAVSVYSRQVELVDATGQPDELFYYAGPVDRITRPFCLRHVGKVYTRAQIEQMDNGQLGDVLLTAGGYSCRHAWKRVSALDQELIDLRDSGKRLPHVEDMVQRAEAEKAKGRAA